MSPVSRKRLILACVVAAGLAFTAISWGQAFAGGRSGDVSGRRPGAFAGKEGLRVAGAGEVTPEKLERWRTMTPAERERIRERYHRWKKLPQQQREKILERKRVWRELPEGQRRFLRQRREIYRDARPREKKAIEKFVNRWKQLPPERRHGMRRDMADWQDLPAGERDRRLMDWPLYRKFSPDDRKAVRRFLFSRPSRGTKGGPRGAPRD